MPQAFIFLYAAVLGLLFGSFANVAVYRLPQGISIVTPPSRCPLCNHRLSVTELIPVLSFILLRGRCKACGGKISARYPLVEVLGGALFLITAMRAGGPLAVGPLCFLSFILLCASFIDADTQEIPDGLSVAGATAAVCWVALSIFIPSLNAPAWHDALLGAATGGGVLFIIDRLTLLIIKQDGFGFGDVKLMAMAGLFLGWKFTLAAFFFAFTLGGGYAAFLLATKKASRGTYLAFAPFLSAGVMASVWWGGLFLAYMGF